MLPQVFFEAVAGGSLVTRHLCTYMCTCMGPTVADVGQPTSPSHVHYMYMYMYTYRCGDQEERLRAGPANSLVAARHAA